MQATFSLCHTESYKPEVECTTGDLASVSRRGIQWFVSDMGLDIVPHVRDLELEARVAQETACWPQRSTLQPHIATGIFIASTTYRKNSIDSKVSIALYTAIAVAMDDPRIIESLSSGTYHYSLCAGTIPESPDLLAELSKVLAAMWEHFPRFGASCILTSTLQFMNMTLLGNEIGDYRLKHDALPFVEYRRIMDGLPEVYFSFIWEKRHFPDVTVWMQAIPYVDITPPQPFSNILCKDAMKFINFGNDILSFYKEESAGETANYIHDRARYTGQSIEVTLMDLVKETTALANRVRQMLGEGAATDAWDSFTQGYLQFHTSNPRYRLREIL
ncbi:predicted protein [Postia placenta Mad-698-R]|uniref:Terpene synthase n=1 Tax=Postia placenta MAD-698-R-SB12 TaxID=670580 RepID=A0A1X6MQG8_9APHY|nr:hypothetical protein POSPLADRAFT_1049326 [Postia placenta MAD-698-R-SB12]EED79818.1 predicted protein [Postia placenta Mad-698-R]OSX58540.1 hypothetical protein POSPLADRAFT_1049326 [Postia placenta MAD-698-R-SB12]